ncbi:MAG: ATP-dependent helicase [Halobacteriaceae archaeon]
MTGPGTVDPERPREAPDADLLDRFHPALADWWVDRFGDHVAANGGLFTAPQRGAIPEIDDGAHTLVAAPTGSGKTLSAFASVLDDLVRRDRADDLPDGVFCVYISPLKSLANDVHRNLDAPLSDVADRVDGDLAVRQAIRHGDTGDAERRRMTEEPPHVLNTTPETLAILLCAPRFREHLRSVEYVVVDEIHALAADKRGTHLAVSLERLTALADGTPTRVGCSATVEPVDAVADFLAGHRDDGSVRERSVVDARFARDYDLALRCPAPDLVETPGSEVRDRFYDDLADLIDGHDCTLVFTNTRSGAERVLHALRSRGAVSEAASGCHHGSLSAERRRAVESGLKEGSLDVVTTSTSLELGIDMPSVDLVVQVGSPKSVASFLQRVGRAGHRPGRTIEGRLFALDRDDLLECAAIVDRATDGFVDRVEPPTGAHDVAAQHVYGMAIAEVRPEREARSILQRAAPYADYGDEDWERLLRYLTADYADLDDHDVYPKVWRDDNDPPGGEHHHAAHDTGEALLGKRGRMARPIYMQNVGTIPDSFDCDVLTRADEEWVGSLDEAYLDTLDPGDVFVLGGDRFAFRYRRGSKVYVDPTDGRPTVPSWYAERLPLSPDVGREVGAFRRKLLARYRRGGPPLVRDHLRDRPVDEHAVRALADLVDRQVRYAGVESVATDRRLTVEEVRDRTDYERRFHVHCPFGRRLNDGLARLLAAKCADRTTAGVQVSVADNGFTLSMPLNRRVDLAGLLADSDPDGVRAALRDALADTELLQRYFRRNAVRSLLVLPRYRGHEKSASRQQVDSEMLLGVAEDLEDFAVLEETYRQLLADRLDVGRLESLLARIRDGEVAVTDRTLDSPSPMAFGLATLSASDVVLAEDEDAVLREFHERVTRDIEDDESGGTDSAVGTDGDSDGSGTDDADGPSYAAWQRRDR